MTNVDISRLMSCKTSICQKQRGVTSIEYALVASLIAMAIVFGVTAVGKALGIGWSIDGWVGGVLDALSP